MAKTSQGTGMEMPEKDGADGFRADAHEQTRIELPSADFIADATLTREGADLIMTTPSGEIAVIENYFSVDPAPLLHAGEGGALTPNLVDAFLSSGNEYAANETASDESPVGAVEEVKGEATVTRADGTVEPIAIGTAIYQGDVVETGADGAVNITFIDETSMAVSEGARLSVDEYTFDPATESGTTNLSVLRGLFVFTSGLIGRDDPDDVKIDTPVGSIGIRGTIIAGDINPAGESKITVLEGAIVVSNGANETTLSERFETVRIMGFDQPMQDMGVVAANDITTRFGSVSDVNPSLFTTLNDAAKEQPVQQQQQPAPDEAPAPQETAPEPADEPVVQEQPPSVFDGPDAKIDIPPSMRAPAENMMMPPAGEAPILMPMLDTTAGQTGFISMINMQPDMPKPLDMDGMRPKFGPGMLDANNALPPPIVIQQNAAANAALTFIGNTFNDISPSGTLVGRVDTGLTGTTYTFAGGSNISADGHYQLVADGSGARVILTAAGTIALGASFDAELDGFGIIATKPGGQTITGNFVPMVVDAHTAADIMNLGGAPTITDNINNQIGYSISALGDVNNDGFDDFIFTNNTSIGGNHSYIIRGSAGGVSTGNFSDANPGALGNPMDLKLNPTLSSDYSQSIVAGIGDFNGDGYEDYVVGQKGGLSETGNAAIISGNTSNATTFGTGLSGDQIGASVASVGDYNNDGYADVVIGAPGSNAGDGAAYLIKGYSGVLTGNISSPLSITGGSSSGFGSSVTSAGDFDGDGYSDMAIGSPGNGANNEGRVSIYLGNKSGTATSLPPIDGINPSDGYGTKLYALGDINGDGKTDLMIGGDGNIAKIVMGGGSAPSVSINTPTGYSLIGSGGVGDFNGDGYDDFTIAMADGTDTNAYVVFGNGTLPSNIDAAYLKNPGNAMEIRYGGADNTDKLEINAIGDVNGDGYDDFAMGVPDANAGAAGNGGVAIVYGRDTGKVSTSDTATVTEKVLVGTSNNDILRDDGVTGVTMRGGAGNDTFHVNNTNFLGIDGGTNTIGNSDRIMMQGNLDFTNVDFEQISRIEAIQFGSANQTLTLTLENIFNLLKSSDMGYLKITGSATNMTLNLDAMTVTGTGENNTAGNNNIRNALNEMGAGAAHETTSDLVGHRQFSIGGYDLYITDNANLTVNVV